MLSSVGARLFNVDDANALIPHLTQLFAPIRAELARARLLAAEVQAEGGTLDGENGIAVDPAAPPHLQSLQRKLGECYEGLARALRKVTELGVEVKSADGLVDFRTRRDGAIVYLCWRFGEDSVAHWHDGSSGFAGREPILDPARFHGEYRQ